MPSPTAPPTAAPTALPTAPSSALPTWAQATRLAPGSKPPQFVVVSWDGAGETSGLFQHYRELAKELHGSMTFFLTGIYVLPASRRTLYQAPGRAAGASDIGFLSDKAVRATLEQVGLAAAEGHEIGTHFNGHFCGKKGVSSWSSADWDVEIEQAVSYVAEWRRYSGITDLPDLPFDYRTDLVGGRTPCLEGRSALLGAQHVKSWRYEASGTGKQVWPKKIEGSHLWDFPLQQLPFPGHTFEVLSMDYNFLANQSKVTSGDPANFAKWRSEVEGAYAAGFARAYDGNRAPLFIGNHFESWNGGIYLAALDSALRQMATKPDVRFVSFRQLSDWLDAQDPAMLAAWQRLPVGTTPKGGWAAKT